MNIIEYVRDTVPVRHRPYGFIAVGQPSDNGYAGALELQQGDKRAVSYFVACEMHCDGQHQDLSIFSDPEAQRVVIEGLVTTRYPAHFYVDLIASKKTAGEIESEEMKRLFTLFYRIIYANLKNYIVPQVNENPYSAYYVTTFGQYFARDMKKITQMNLVEIISLIGASLR